MRGDGEADDALGDADLDLVADALAEQGSANGRFVADQALASGWASAAPTIVYSIFLPSLAVA